MLTFTHTFLLERAYIQVHGKPLEARHGEALLGNAMPDFVTHLDRDRYQEVAHDIGRYTAVASPGPLERAGLFHVLCDNYSTLGRISFEGSYHSHARRGFIEQRARKVQMDLPLKAPQRRVLQSLLDMLVLEAEGERLRECIRFAAGYLFDHRDEVIERAARLYGIPGAAIETGIGRFSQVYGPDWVEKTGSPKYRLFPLARGFLGLPSLADPNDILEGINQHPELLALVETNRHLLENDWRQVLEETARAALEWDDLRNKLESW